MREPRNNGRQDKHQHEPYGAESAIFLPAGRLLSSEVTQAGDSVHHRPHCRTRPQEPQDPVLASKLNLDPMRASYHSSLGARSGEAMSTGQ